MVYHPGKVIAVLSPKDKNVKSADSSVQATLKMWDENVLTMLVDAKIAPFIHDGDLVLADYRPQKGLSVPVARNIIIKIMKGKAAERMWDEYREVNEKRKRQAEGKEEKHSQQSYIG
jgi:hypothetical protein